MPQTLFDKVWNQHLVAKLKNGTDLIYIDRHLIHEVTSPQAFEGLEISGRFLRRPELTTATLDHNIPTRDKKNITDKISKQQVEALEKNCKKFGIQLFDLDSPYQGIVHVIGPELGLTQPGMTIVCGDSHTSTHGAFGALAFGIGTSEVEHVFATQCLQLKKPKTYLVNFNGSLSQHVTSKDMILHLIGRIGTAGGSGFVIEYAGSAIRNLSMESRMTICNMSIEAGARAGMIAPDQTTFDYFLNQERAFAPKGQMLKEAMSKWSLLPSDPRAKYDRKLDIDVTDLAPQVTWGTNPAMVSDVNGVIPYPDNVPHCQAQDVEKALSYMDLHPGQKITDLKIDVVFIGSCTNARIEDLRAAATVFKGNHIHKKVRALIVPGSELVKREAEAEGLDKIFLKAGAEWRDPGCSMCLAMNPDKLDPGERCASTSNRNFEGRQGQGGRTHLVSSQMAAAAAIKGRFFDVRKL